MTDKLMGALLLGLGLIAIILLAGICKRQPHSSANVPVRKYRLSHEYNNKGFSEKNQSEGMLNVPTSSDIENGHHSDLHSDLFLTSSADTDTSSPGDNF